MFHLKKEDIPHWCVWSTAQDRQEIHSSSDLTRDDGFAPSKHSEMDWDN